MLVAVRTKAGEDRTVYYIESSPDDQLQPKLHSHTYAKPGDRIPIDRPRLFRVASRTQVPVSDELFPNPWSIAEIRWAPIPAASRSSTTSAATSACGYCR